MNYFDCSFCSRPEIARHPVRIGSFRGHACNLCIDGLALHVARYSRARSEVVRPLKEAI